MIRPFRTAAIAALAFLTFAVAQPDRPSADRLKAQLQSKSPVVRMRALTKLAELGSGAVAATEAVETLLKSDAVEERLAASAVLIRLDPKRYDTDIRAVRDALRAKDAQTRSAALSALRLLGREAKQEYGAVVAALFSRCGEPGAKPFAALVDQSVLRAFGDAAGPPPKDTVLALVSAMADADPTARHVADCLLWRVDIKADPSALLPLLKHKEGYARLAGARALARFERLPASAVAAAVAALTDREARPYLVEILVHSAPDSVAHLPAMQKELDDPLERAWLAARIDPIAHGEAVAKLIAERLDDLRKRGQEGGAETRRLARMAEALGPLAKSAAPALARSFGESTRGALSAIGPAAVPELRAILRDPKRADRHDGAVVVLGGFGSEASDAVPELVALLEAGAKPAKPRIGEAAPEHSPEDHLLLTLNAIGPAAVRPEVLKALKRRLQAGDNPLLTILVAKLGPKAKELAPTLADLLSKARKTEGERFLDLQLLPFIGLLGIDPTNPALKDTLRRFGKDVPEPLPLPVSALLEEVYVNFSAAGTDPGGAKQKVDSGGIDAIARILKSLPELQEPARKWIADCLDGKSIASIDGPLKFSYPVYVPAALAQLNATDLPLALKTFGEALGAGDSRPLVVLRRLGVAAKPVAPAVKRFLDKQPAGLAYLGEGYDPGNKPAERGGGCMFCAPASSKAVAAGLVSPPEPFLPSQLKAPVYTSVDLRVLAAETLTAISAGK